MVEMSSNELDNKSTKAGPGKKQCKNCLKYIGVRSANCKYCKTTCAKSVQKEEPQEQSEPAEDRRPVQYVYEHIRTDTWEKEITDKILSKELDSYWAPTQWRNICYSLEEVLKRNGVPYAITLKEDLNRIIIKCIPTNNFKPHENKRIGILQEMKIVKIIGIGDNSLTVLKE